MIVDIAVGVVLLISALISFVRGFVREILTIAGVVGGLAAAYFFGGSFIPVMRGWLGVVDNAEEPQKLFDIIPMIYLADGLAYLSIFLVVVIVISIASHFISEGLKNIGLGAIDRTFGVIFGLARGMLVLGMFFILLNFAGITRDHDSLQDSRTILYVDYTAKFLMKFVPAGTKEALEETAQDAEEAVKTKDKLEQMNLLQKEDSVPADQEEAPGEGYQDHFRDDMNQLFERQQDADSFKELREQKGYNE